MVQLLHIPQHVLNSYAGVIVNSNGFEDIWKLAECIACVVVHCFGILEHVLIELTRLSWVLSSIILGAGTAKHEGPGVIC